MASKRAFSEEDFTCSVCYDIFKEPVILSCGHSVCRVCVRKYWDTKGNRECPLCRKRSVKNPPVNLALRELSQTFAQHRGHPDTLCPTHDETLKLYCVDDGQLVCVVCRDSIKHQEHTCRPVDEIAAELKDVLKSALKTVRMKIKSLQDAQDNCHQTIDHIRKQAQHIRSQLKEEFAKLHQFLREENTAIITALRTEEYMKRQMLEEKIKTMNEEMLSLSRTIRETESELKHGDIDFLKNFERTLGKAQCTQMDPDVASVDVINVTEYLGNLQYRVWKKMQNIIVYTPVVLDPNTAHSQLILSADLSSVRDRDDNEEESNIKVPYTAERFDRSFCVLGSECFSLGVHMWDIEVGNNTYWMVGVITESANRKEQSFYPRGVWGIGYDNKILCAHSPSEAYNLPEAAIPQRVRVYLNMNAGKILFSDPLSGSVIYRFSHRFREKVFPFFHSMCSLSPLKILPLQPNVELRRLS